MTAGHPGATVVRSTDGSSHAHAVRRALDALPSPWTVLHDVAWPGRGPVVVDHVVVGPPGVFVVRRGRARTAQHPRSGRSAVAAAAAVAAAVPFVPRHQVHALVCVAGAAPTRADRCPGEQLLVQDALVVGATDLVTTLLTRPAILPPDHALALGAALRAELEPAARPARPAPVAARAPRRTPSTQVTRGPRGVTGVRGARLVGAGLATAVLAAVLVAPQLALNPVQWAAGGVRDLGPDDRFVAGGSATTETTPGAADPEAGDPDTDGVQGADEQQDVAGADETTAAPEIDEVTTGGTDATDETGTTGELGTTGAATTPTTGPTTAGSSGEGQADGGTAPVPGAGASTALGGRGGRGGAAGGVSGGAGAGVGAVVGTAPTAAAFVTLLRSLLGPGGRDPDGTGLSGVLGSLTDLVRNGSLPGGLLVGGFPSGPGRCVHDTAADISLVLAVNGRDGHLALREGPCSGGRELARVVERGAADYRLRGNTSLARPVARLLRPTGRAS